MQHAALQLAGHVVEGISVAGQETCVWLPRLKLAFDFGRCPQRVVSANTFCLTHGHMDHVGGLPLVAAARLLQGLPPPVVLLPRCAADDVRALLDVHARLGDCELPVRLVPLDAGEEHALSDGVKVLAFKTCHRVASQGYLVYSRKRVLLPHLRGLPQDEIKARVYAGEAVSALVETPEVAFTGDTTAEYVALALAAGEDGGNGNGSTRDVLRARLLITECTYVDDRVTRQHAAEVGHLHIGDLIDAAPHLAQHEAILLTHFSARYRSDDVEAALAARLPPGLRERCTPLLTGFSPSKNKKKETSSEAG